MYHIAVLQSPYEAITRSIERLDFGESGGVVITCLDRISGLGEEYDFVVISHDAAKQEDWSCGQISRCGILLVPGKYAVRAAEVITSGCIVDYGLSSRDTITLSSIETKQVVLAIQREFITLNKTVLDRQEVPIRYKNMPPEALMALAGSLIILGVPVEELSEQIIYTNVEK